MTIIGTNISKIALGYDVGVFDGVLNPNDRYNLAASFIGTELANEIGDWNEVGEQIGSQIGSALGASIGHAVGSTLGQFAVPLPILGSAIGAFFGNETGRRNIIMQAPRN